MLESIKVRNHLSKEVGVLVPLLNEKIISNEDILQLKNIFNSHDVYDKLFRRTLKNKTFSLENVKRFIKWSVAQTQSGNNITYIIRDKNDTVCGGIDLQKVDFETVTIGYWADPKTPGFITNSVKEIIKVAKEIGYKNIDAYPEEGNEKSIKVLNRLGFNYVEKIIKPDKVLLKYIVS